MKKFLKSPWTIPLGSTIFGFVLIIIYDLAKGKKILSSIGGILVWVWNLIIKILNFNIKVWWLLLGLVIILIVIYLIAKFTPEKNLPEFLNYTKDNIQGWNWEWDWYKNSYGKYDIENLHPVCPKCSTPLVNANDYSGSLCCLRCNYITRTQMPSLNNVKVIIIDNVKRNLQTNAGGTNET